MLVHGMDSSCSDVLEIFYFSITLHFLNTLVDMLEVRYQVLHSGWIKVHVGLGVLGGHFVLV